jgi:hypothetical protein
MCINNNTVIIYYFIWLCSPARAMASFTRLLDLTKRRATVDRTSVDEWSARRRDFYLKTHNTQTSISPVGFEPTIAAGERPQTYALDRAATGTDNNNTIISNNCGRLEELILLIKIIMSAQEKLFETYRQFGHAPSNRFASPVVYCQR